MGEGASTSDPRGGNSVDRRTLGPTFPAPNPYQAQFESPLVSLIRALSPPTVAQMQEIQRQAQRAQQEAQAQDSQERALAIHPEYQFLEQTLPQAMQVAEDIRGRAPPTPGYSPAQQLTSDVLQPTGIPQTARMIGHVANAAGMPVLEQGPELQSAMGEGVQGFMNLLPVLLGGAGEGAAGRSTRAPFPQDFLPIDQPQAFTNSFRGGSRDLRDAASAGVRSLGDEGGLSRYESPNTSIHIGDRDPGYREISWDLRNGNTTQGMPLAQRAAIEREGINSAIQATAQDAASHPSTRYYFQADNPALARRYAKLANEMAAAHGFDVSNNGQTMTLSPRANLSPPQAPDAGGAGVRHVWHVSPHKINGQFRTDLAGTGESKGSGVGALAYGPGGYFTESPGVRDFYYRQFMRTHGNAHIYEAEIPAGDNYVNFDAHFGEQQPHIRDALADIYGGGQIPRDADARVILPEEAQRLRSQGIFGTVYRGGIQGSPDARNFAVFHGGDINILREVDPQEILAGAGSREGAATGAASVRSGAGNGSAAAGMRNGAGRNPIGSTQAAPDGGAAGVRQSLPPGVLREIDDSAARVNFPQWPAKSRTYRLSELLDHSELYDIYPQLRDFPVVIGDARLHGGHYGNAGFASEDRLLIDPSQTREFTGNKNLPSFRAVIAHELQHAVDRIEGRDVGGSSPGWLRRNVILPPGVTPKTAYPRVGTEQTAFATERRIGMNAEQRAASDPFAESPLGYRPVPLIRSFLNAMRRGEMRQLEAYEMARPRVERPTQAPPTQGEGSGGNAPNGGGVEGERAATPPAWQDPRNPPRKGADAPPGGGASPDAIGNHPNGAERPWRYHELPGEQLDGEMYPPTPVYDFTAGRQNYRLRLVPEDPDNPSNVTIDFGALGPNDSVDFNPPRSERASNATQIVSHILQEDAARFGRSAYHMAPSSPARARLFNSILEHSDLPPGYAIERDQFGSPSIVRSLRDPSASDYAPRDAEGNQIATPNYPFGFRPSNLKSGGRPDIDTRQFYPIEPRPELPRTGRPSIESLPTESLIGTQEYVARDFLNRRNASGVADPIEVLRDRDGRNIILNGHHR